MSATEDLAELAARLDSHAEIGRRANTRVAPAELADMAETVRRIALRVAEDDDRAGRHARIVALARLAVDGNERDLGRLLAAEQVQQ